MDELMKIQLEMIGLGWDIETKISGEGWRDSVGYMIWFKRSDWHGKFTYTITGHEVVFVGNTKDANDYAAVLKMVKQTAEKAKKAWDDFPDSIPYQNAKGEVRKDIMFCTFEEGRDIKNVPKENQQRYIPDARKFVNVILVFDEKQHEEIYNALVHEMGFPKDIFKTYGTLMVNKSDCDKIMNALPDVAFKIAKEQK